MKKKRLRSIRKPTQARSLETIEAILKASAQILVRDGISACSTNRIAERAGISIGTLYQYFSDRQSVLSELFIREIRKDSAAIESCLKGLEGQPIHEVVPRIIEITLNRLSEEPRLRQILMQEFATSRQLEELKDIKKHIAGIITAHLRAHPQLQIQRSFRLEMLIVVNAVEAALYAAIWEFGPRLQRQRLIEEVSDLVLRYLSKYS